jgi:hypothetical protein
MRQLLVVPALFVLSVSGVTSASALNAVSATLSSDTLVQQDDLGQNPGGGSVLMQAQFFLSVSTTVTAIASFRWFPADPATTAGDRVAYIRVDGTDRGTLMITDSRPNGLTQFSTSGSYVITLAPGWHTIAVHFGGCCGITGHPFYVGGASRLDVVW